MIKTPVLNSLSKDKNEKCEKNKNQLHLQSSELSNVLSELSASVTQEGS